MLGHTSTTRCTNGSTREIDMRSSRSRRPIDAVSCELSSEGSGSRFYFNRSGRTTSRHQNLAANLTAGECGIMDIEIHIPGQQVYDLRRTDCESLLRNDSTGGSRYAGEWKGDAAGNANRCGVDVSCCGSGQESSKTHIDRNHRLVIAEDDAAVSRSG